MRRLTLDQLQRALPQVRRRHDQTPVELLPRHPGQRIEQVTRIGPDLRIAREESDIRVQARRFRVVVARADVHVSPDAIGIASHYQHRLGVRLEPRQSIRHVDAIAFHRACERDVVLFVEACLQFDDHRDLLARLGSCGKRAHNSGVSRCTVQSELDRQHLRIA